MNGNNANNIARENLWKEYDVVASSWRFFSGIRFTAAAFAVTLQSAVITLLLQSTGQQTALTDLHPASIPTFGIILIIASWIIERRSIKLFRIMIARGKSFEFRLGITDGHFSNISEPILVRPPGLKRFTTYAVSIHFIYDTICFFWLILLLTSLY